MAPATALDRTTTRLLLLSLTLTLAWTTPLWAQGPGVGANNLGIDGDLLANSPPGPPFNTADDWLDGPAGPGIGLLDQNGMPRDPSRTTHVIDPIDGDPLERRFFGGNKVDDDPNTYRWTYGAVPQKDDIQNGLIDFYVDPVSGDLWVGLAGDRRSTNGDSYIDFELLQNSLTRNAEGTFTSAGPDGGRTLGDVLLTVHLTNGGSVAEFFAQRWEAVGSGFDFVEFMPPAGTAFVAANTDSQVVVPYGAFGSTLYEINAFGEASANLTDLVQLSGCYGINTVFIRTKSSPSASAELKDFIEPHQVDICVDRIPPVIACPPDITIECDESTSPDNTGYATATDNCPGEITLTYEDVFTQGGCPQEGTIDRTWTATDACGNSASCVQTITIEDTTAPIIVCPPDVTVSCTDPTHPDYTGYATATDNCAPDVIITWSDEIIPGDCGGPELAAKGTPSPAVLAQIAAARGVAADKALSGNQYVIVRTWTGTDSGQLGKDGGPQALTCGNTATCTQIITVFDDSAPVITCPPDITIECDESTSPDNTGYATATDDCPGEITLTYEDVFTQGGCPQEGTIDRTWTATDVCGNSASCVQTITIEDTTAPIILYCPPDVTVGCDDPTHPDYTGYAIAEDNCDPNPLVTWSDEIIPGDCGTPPPVKAGGKTMLAQIAAARGVAEAKALFGIQYVIVRTWTGTDSGQLGKDGGPQALTCGNTVTCTQIITVVDDEPPLIVTCPDPITVQCAADVPLPDPGLVTASDSCTEVTVTHVSDTSDGGTCPETITRTYRATDECGNAADCVQIITIWDTISPQLTCPPDETLPCGSTPACGDPVATDNCDPTPEIILVSSVTVPGPNGSTVTTCTWEAIDDCGNASTRCSQTITVLGCPEDHFCSLTQGFYGNEGGTFNGQEALPIIEQVVAVAPIVVGKPGRSLTIPLAGASCIVTRLPAGGNAAGLPDIDDAVLTAPECQTMPLKLPLDRNGKFRNVLLGQTIALTLNVRLDDAGIVDTDLASFHLEPQFCTRGSLPGPDGIYGTGDDEPDPNSPILSFTIPGPVLTALTSLGLQRDVGGLLELANRSLAGLPTGDASRAAINAAVDAVNRGFDRCRFVTPCTIAAKPSANSSGMMQIAGAGFEGPTGGEMPLGAPAHFELGPCYPNPFNPHTRFTLALPEPTTWSVDIYDVGGHLVRRFRGEASRAEYVRIEWDGTNDSGEPVAPGVYLYRAVAGSSSATRKAILLK